MQSGRLQRSGDSSISLKKEAGIDQASGSWEEFPREEAVSELKCLSILEYSENYLTVGGKATVLEIGEGEARVVS